MRGSLLSGPPLTGLTLPFPLGLLFFRDSNIVPLLTFCTERAVIAYFVRPKKPILALLTVLPFEIDRLSISPTTPHPTGAVSRTLPLKLLFALLVKLPYSYSLHHMSSSDEPILPPRSSPRRGSSGAQGVILGLVHNVKGGFVRMERQI